MNARIVGPHLSPRQAEVLAAAADGAPVTEVARRVGMPRPQVASHLSRAYQRLDVAWMDRVDRRAAAVRVARRAGLIPEPAAVPSGGTGPRRPLEARVSASESSGVPAELDRPERQRGAQPSRPERDREADRVRPKGNRACGGPDA